VTAIQGAEGQRFKEGVEINKGLLTLGNVISALGDEVSKPSSTSTHSLQH
jgi:Kinesin motor domain